MCILPLLCAPTITAPPQPLAASASAAAGLSPQQRLHIARDALAGRSITALAQQHHVSRKFIRRQRQLALAALDRAFTPAPPPDQQVLFYLPVTRAWLEQLSLALVLICHSSLRGVHEVLRDLFDVHKSIGAIHALLTKAVAKASHRNGQQDLSRVGEAALDEIFQSGAPILSVVDAASTYCCLLNREEQRDSTTWGIRLLELGPQGFQPHAIISDAARGLRGGAAAALPAVPCKADVFHAERDLGRLVRFLENRAYAALSSYDQLQRQALRHPDDERLRQQLQAERGTLAQAVALADDVTMLAEWLRQDVLSVAGPPLAQRQELFEFVLAELLARTPLCAHRLGPVCSLLRRQQGELLAFVAEVELDLSSLAAWAGVPAAVVRELVAVQELPATSVRKWQRDAVLRRQLGQRYHELSQLVQVLRAGVVRASSVVENVNSRLRNYFFLRKEVGQGSLELLRFFLNHRRFLRSEHEERVGKSPAELLSGQEHEHWLELLGYQLFRRSV